MTNDTLGLILLVEDDAVQRRLYNDVLINLGYTVFAAETVQDAEQFLAEQMPALILLDVMMPEVNGIDACKRFRQTLGQRVPILFLTAADTMDVVLAAMKAGGDDYIVKGSPATLIERIAHWRKADHVDLTDRRLRAVAYLESRMQSSAKSGHSDSELRFIPVIPAKR